MNDQLKDIGMRIACMREDCDMTDVELAEKLGVDIETYRSYEKGEIDFSFSFVYNVAEKLGVDVLDIISGTSPTLSTCCVVKKGKGFSVTRDDGYDYKHLAYTFKNKKSEPFLVTVNPDEKTPVLHSHEGQEFNYLLSGKLTFYIGDISYEIEPGDSIYFDSGVSHAIKVTGDEPAQFIAVVVK